MKNIFKFIKKDGIGNPPWERNFGRVESSEGSEPEVTGNPLLCRRKRHRGWCVFLRGSSKMPIAISYGVKHYEHF